MNTIVVAISEPSTTFNLLPPVCVSQDYRIMFHRAPHVEISEGEANCNFDYHVDFGLHPDEISSLYLGKKYIHLPRQTRTAQMATIDKFNKTKMSDIRIHAPFSYVASFGEDVSVIPMARFGIPRAESVVLKHQYGARGSNQIIVPKHLLSSVLNGIAGRTGAEIKKRFPTLIYSPMPNPDKVLFESTNAIFVCDYIEDVSREYRVLVAGDDLYLRQREISHGDYPQANLDLRSTKPIHYRPIHKTLDEKQIKLLKGFVDYAGIKFGSIDVYVTDKRRLGIFEYSNEFGIHAEDPSFIRPLLVSTIENLIVSE